MDETQTVADAPRQPGEPSTNKPPVPPSPTPEPAPVPTKKPAKE